MNVSYTIDPTDRLIDVNEGWNRFALENDAPGLVGVVALNRSIWSFIQGAEVIHVYQTLAARSRQDGRTFELPFRCDSSSVRRYMRMVMEPQPDGAIRFETWLDRVEPVALPDPIAPGLAIEPAFVPMCSWCKRIRVEDHAWAEVEDAVRERDLLGADPYAFTHTICPACRGRTAAMLS